MRKAAVAASLLLLVSPSAGFVPVPVPVPPTAPPPAAPHCEPPALRLATIDSPSVEEFEEISKHASRFRQMLGRLTRYSDAELRCVPDARLRRMLVGVVEGAETPEVVGAFEILYEDYFAIRKVGDFIFSSLDTTVERAVQARQDQLQELDLLVDSGKLSAGAVAAAHRAFQAPDRDRNGELKREELVVSALLDRVPTLADIPPSVELEADGNISFEETENPEERKRTKHSGQFDSMVEQFSEWEAKILDAGGASVASGNARLRTVLNGCFVGARTPGVVEALRIVYEDYPPLRLAGDLIFRLMKKVVA